MESNEIISLLKKNRDFIFNSFELDGMGVFGSYANGTQSQESDIDILLTPKQHTIFSYKKKIGLEKFLVELLNIEKIDLVNIRYLNPVIKNSAEKNIIYV
jgi:hypothetical protein